MLLGGGGGGGGCGVVDVCDVISHSKRAELYSISPSCVFSKHQLIAI